MSSGEHRPLQIVYLRHRRNIYEVFLFYMENCQFHFLITWLFLSEQIETFWADGQIGLAEACWSHGDWSLDRRMLQFASGKYIFPVLAASSVCKTQRVIDSLVSSVEQTSGSSFILCKGKKQIEIYLEKNTGKKISLPLCCYIAQPFQQKVISMKIIQLWQILAACWWPGFPRFLRHWGLALKSFVHSCHNTSKSPYL